MAAALLLGSIGFGILAWWAGRVDLISLIEQRIGTARGTTSKESIERLRQIDWRGLFMFAAAALGVSALVVQRFARTAAQHLLELRSQQVGSAVRSTGWIMPLVCGVAVFVRYHATLRYGFFRYDDFDFLSYARDYPLKEAIWLPHGDHFYPLTRVLAHVAVHLFGTTPWPYNLGALVCLWLTATLGCRLLGEMRVSVEGQLLFAVLFLFWSPWAELLGGYYILSAYMLIAALGLATILCYWRWRKTGSALASGGAALCVGAATLVDTSGWYVPPAFAVFLAADFANADPPESLRRWFARHARLLVRVGTAIALSLGVTVLCYTVFSSGLFLSMGEHGQRTLSRLVADFAYLLNVGLLVSMAVPFVYARLPQALLVAIGAAALLTFSVFLLGAWRRANRGQRFSLAAIMLVIAGSALMVNLGRPSGETIIVRWAAKHVCPAYLWLCLLIAAAWHILWTASSGKRRVVLGEMTLIFVGAFWIAQTAFGALGLAVSFPPFGYPAEIRDATTRRRNVEDLHENIINLITREIDIPITVPTLDGAYIHCRHPSLFDYNLTRYLSFFGLKTKGIAFVRNAAMQTAYGSGLVTVPVLREAVSPAFFDLLKRDSALREYYFADIPLRFQQSEKGPAGSLASDLNQIMGTEGRDRSDRVRLVESDGRTELTLREEPFDPESLPHLRLQIEPDREDARGDVTLEVAFRNDFGLGRVHATLSRSVAENGVVVADLRQVYAFALSRRVSSVRLVFVEPGTYHVRVAELRH